MHRSFRSLIRASSSLLCAGLLLSGRFMFAQAEPTATSSGAETEIPQVHGLNFSVANVGVHNSSTGWADVTTPVLTYRFNPHFDVAASVPWYPLVTAYVPSKNGNNTQLRTGNNLLGDTSVAGHFEASGTNLDYIGTAVLNLPTGDVRYGIGAGSTTYNITNHFDYGFGWLTPDIEIGEGNNSSLGNPTVRKGYVATGPLANFQAGAAVDLPLNLGLDLELYENLPLGSQNVNGTVTRKGKRGKTRTTQTLNGGGSAEDNGLNAELDVPFGRHLVFMSVYERSFIQGLDTVSAGLSWTLRAPKKE